MTQHLHDSRESCQISESDAKWRAEGKNCCTIAYIASRGTPFSDIYPSTNAISSFNMADVDSLLLSLIEKEIPEGRQALRDGHENLAKVAAYCEQKYIETNNRYKSGSDRGQALKETRAVLDETKQFATQSLASVAYQINTLALNMLSLLDQQVLKMQDMESRINHIAEVRLPR